MKAKKFGKSSEKLDKQIEQLELLIEENEQEFAKADVVDAATDVAEVKERQIPKRQKLPNHLPREDIVNQLEIA
ncbi:MAG: transposase [Rickettsiaceae bacterium]|nr:transposase [Rickettsiaceae bacterium]